MSDSSQNDLIPAWEGGILRAVGKLDVHRRGLRHKAVSVFVRSGNRLLLQKRALDKYHSGGLWANTCCTHPFWDEEPEHCAHRRLKEEIGATGLKLTYRGQVEYRADVGNNLIEHELVDVFLAEAATELPLTLNPVEVSAVKWVNIDQLQEDLVRSPTEYSAWLRIYMDKHLTTILPENSI